MTKQLFNGWIDGSVEPEDGCKAWLWSYEFGEIGWAQYSSQTGFWLVDIETCYQHKYVTCYFPIPPHDKLMTTGSTILETNND